MEEEDVINVLHAPATGSGSQQQQPGNIPSSTGKMEQIIKQYIYGELVTNIHSIQTPAVKKYKANTTNIHVDKTGIVLRAGVFRRFNYMWKHYSFHLDRYTHRSELHGDMVDAVMNASFARSESVDSRKRESIDSRKRSSTSGKHETRSPTGTKAPGLGETSHYQQQNKAKNSIPLKIVAFRIENTSVCLCHRLQKVNNDMQDKEGGLIATLGSVEIIGHKQEAMEEDDYNDPSPVKRKGSANIILVILTRKK